jgi:hypothetical protein
MSHGIPRSQPATQAGGPAAPLRHLCVCQSRCVSGKHLSHIVRKRFPSLNCLHSSDMIKGERNLRVRICMQCSEHLLPSVMSGVITGPYFLKFFNDPTALEVGTMVAVLEIGAFGNVLPTPPDRSLTSSACTITSYLGSCWMDRGLPRTKGHAIRGSCDFCSRRCSTNTYTRFLDHGSWKGGGRVWRRPTIVCPTITSGPLES